MYSHNVVYHFDRGPPYLRTKVNLILSRILMARNRKWQDVFSAMYPAFLVTLLVTGNIGGDGDGREDIPI